MLPVANLIIIGLSAATIAFTVSTIVLAVQKSELNNELDDAQQKLELLEQELWQSTTTSTTTTTTTTTTTQPTTLSSSTSSTESTTSTTVAPVNYRLSGSVRPIHYDLHLNPDISTDVFVGQVLIDVYTTIDTNQIELHSADLNISNVYVASSSTKVSSYSLDTVREVLQIELKDVIAADQKFKIGIIFNGQLTGKLSGLYSSTYLKEDGTRKAIATSKFEPTYARQAFPCFDEPDMKATFAVTLVYPSTGNYHALSNMDVAKTVIQGNYTEAYFNTSVLMSTYLTCFVVSDFAANSATVDTKGIGEAFNISVYASPEQINKVEFALEVGKSVIEYYISYFKIPYPLPKLDMAAIPDFVSGAMENWGLVTYRETSLLYEEGVSATNNRQRVASVIAHEFAHMWFGNLVTMKWWNDLWLNEGFAQYIQDKGVNSKFPEWQMEDQFLVNTLHAVMSSDASTASHPIIQTVSTPDQITEIFDTITYSKGASMIRMLENFIGADNFQKAVTNYLNEYKYGNAVSANFFAEIDKLELGINVSEIMRTWSEQMGLPVIEVTQVSTNQYKLTQNRFLSNPDEYAIEQNDSPFSYKWSIPVTYITSASSNEIYQWFYYNQNEVTITLPTTVSWIKLNHNQVGYYRVNYPEEMWENLANILVESPNVFSVSNRASLLNDAFALADATQLNFEISLDMTRYLSKEYDYVPWSVAASRLTSLKNKLMFTDTFMDYSSYARALILPIYEQVTWEVGTVHLQNYLRVEILGAACSLGVESCLTEAGSRLNTWLANPSTRPHPDIRSTVYYYGMMAIGNEATWEQMWQLFVKETDASEKSRLMSGLAGVQVPWILQKFINLAWNEEYVRSQDYFTCLNTIAGNPVGEPLVWEYVRENWPNIVDRFTLNNRYLGTMISTITGRFHTQTKLEEIEAFFSKYPEAGAGENARKRALANTKANIAWLNNNQQKVSTWLTQQAL